ncbi:hypothetical protein GUM07_04035 [Listeria monocytogenes]|nr:hypothetical protein [Listeria monocytogenes]
MNKRYLKKSKKSSVHKLKVIDENVFLDDFQLYGIRKLDIRASTDSFFNELKLEMFVEKTSWK